MKKTLCIVLLFFAAACESTPTRPEIQYQEVPDASSHTVTCKSKEGKYFVFKAVQNRYQITLTDLTYDMDLTLGEYNSSDQFEDQMVLAVSKTADIDNEEIIQTVEPGKKYLIEVYNYSEATATGEMTIAVQ